MSSANKSALALALGLLVSGSGCSLVKLSDDITQATCSKDSDCDVLNDKTSPDFDACELWQCNPTSDHCEFMPLDGDHDGFTPATVAVDANPDHDIMCEQKVEKQDCDDDNKARTPGSKERCDNIDNDCDLHIDEGVLMPHDNPALGFSADGTGNVSYATDPVSGKLAVAYSLNTGNGVVGYNVLDNGLPSGPNATPLARDDGSNDPFIAAGAGVGALGDDRFAVAFYNLEGLNKRMVAGFVETASGTGTLHMTDDVRDKGLHCSKAETKDGKCTVKQPASSTPALAGLDDKVIVSYVRDMADASCVKKSESVAGAPLLANLLELGKHPKTDETVLVETTPEAVVIGQAGDSSGPSLLEVPAAEEGKTYGVLVAYVDPDGAIQIQALRPDGDTLSVSAALATLADKDQRFVGVRLALGPKTDDGQQVAITYQRGCTVDARVGYQLFNATLSAGGDPKLAALGGPTEVGGSPNERDANLAYSKDRNSWIVVYRDPKGLRGRVLDAASKPLGTEPYVLMADVVGGSATTKTLLTPAVVPTLAAGGWFSALVYSDRAGGAHQFSGVTLSSCGKSGN